MGYLVIDEQTLGAKVHLPSGLLGDMMGEKGKVLLMGSLTTYTQKDFPTLATHIYTDFEQHTSTGIPSAR